jgi:hypothetical protein
MTRWNAEELGVLLGDLPPVPEAWTQAAREVPRTRRELGEAIARIGADEEFRRRVADDIDAALGPGSPERRTARAAVLRARLNRLP